MPAILQDLRFAVRVLARNPGYAVTAVLTLAVGIGAATAIFTVLSRVLLEPLPYREPERLVILRADTATATQALLSSQEVAELRLSGFFDRVGAMNLVEGSLTGEGDMESVTAASATDSFLRVLGVDPLLGRHLSLREDVSDEVVSGVVISYELWQRHYGLAPDTLGRRIDVNNLPVTVVGILPRGFRVHLDPRLAVPERIDLWFPRDLEGTPPERFEITVARLKAGVTPAQAQTMLDGISARVVGQYPGAYPERQLTLRGSPLQDDMGRSVRPALVALMAAVSILLLMSCANVAHLTLARGSVRVRELAVRQALGATPRRLIRLLIMESLLLGAAAGLVGLLLGHWGVSVLRTVAAAGAHIPRIEQVAIDLPVLLFTVLISVGAVAAFGLVPALLAARRDLLPGLRTGAASGGAAHGEGRLRSLLVISEVALLFVLLVAGGLVLRAVTELQRVPLGFQPDGVIVARTEIAGRFFRDPLKREAFYRSAIAAVAGMPGVQTVSLGAPLPLDGGRAEQLFAKDDQPSSPPQTASRSVIWAGYLRTMGIPLLDGRELTDDDLAAHRRAIVVDETLARALWPGRSAVGQQLWLDPKRKTAGWAEVVGVAGAVQSDTLRAAGRGLIYTPYHLSPRVSMSLIVRSDATAAALAPELKRRIEGLGGRRPVHAVLPLRAYVDDQAADGRFALFVFSVLGIVGLAVGMAGLYGVLAYTTAKRMHEIGVRLALGARPLAVCLLVAGRSLAATAAGILLGAIAAGLVTRYLQTLLFQVSPLDPRTFAAVAGLLLLVALAASIIPARRALRADPKSALGAE